MLTTIRKRDGREVAFDPNKITEAIYKAAQSVGGSDREMAMELAFLKKAAAYFAKEPR